MAWDSLEDRNIWLREEERSKVIKLRIRQQGTNTVENGGWMEKHHYVCARQGMEDETVLQRDRGWNCLLKTRFGGGKSSTASKPCGKSYQPAISKMYL